MSSKLNKYNNGKVIYVKCILYRQFPLWHLIKYGMVDSGIAGVDAYVCMYEAIT